MLFFILGMLVRPFTANPPYTSIWMKLFHTF